MTINPRQFSTGLIGIPKDMLRHFSHSSNGLFQIHNYLYMADCAAGHDLQSYIPIAWADVTRMHILCVVGT